MTRPLKRWIAIPTSFAIVFTLWYVVGFSLLVRTGETRYLPLPHQVMIELVDLIQNDNFMVDIFHSVLRIAAGVALGALPAIPIGFWFGMNPAVHSVGDPLFAFIKYIPPVSFMPILVIWVGIGFPQQVALLFIGIFFYLTISVAKTVSDTPTALLEAGRTLGLSGLRLVRQVVFPHALPHLIEHLRTMVGIAWTYLVAVEMIDALSGIGRVIKTAQQFAHTDKVLAGMLTIGLLGVCIDRALVMASRVLCRWKTIHEER